VTPVQSPERAGHGRTALVTVTFNSAGVLPDFLASLSLQDNREWSLIVIDNASGDGSTALLEAWDGPLHALVRNAENVGFARGSNQGIRMAMEAGYDAVLLINNDTSFAPDFLSKLLHSPVRDQAPIVVPVVRHAGRSDRCWYAGGHFARRWGALEVVVDYTIPDNVRESWRTEFAPACCKLVDMTVFRQIGLFDEQFFVYWEDADYCLRCRDAGIPIHVVRTPMLDHKPSSLTGGERSPFFIDQYHRNQIKLIRKRSGGLSFAAQSLMIVVKVVARCLSRRDSWAETRGRFRAIRSELFGRRPAREQSMAAERTTPAPQGRGE
jgi:GT2 family glycosyltransferase